MYLRENPVLQRELLVNLRMGRAFLLLFAYVALLGGVVLVAWPQTERVNLKNAAEAKQLFDLFVLGQFILVSMMAPSFAAGSITGEKERKSYEMLLASPLRPAAVLLGKLLSSLCYLALLIFSSLPIVMICLPLGGVSFYEVLAAYVALILSATTFGMICIACSSYFQRTASALAVSYLLILPLALIGVLLWSALASLADFRLMLTLTILPAVCISIWVALFFSICKRLLHPPDVGSEGKEVYDEDRELQTAVGMVIQRDQFPDKLFAPARRNDLLPEASNPVYDKEMRSEIFSQGTLMLRLVIQVSMFLAIFLMGVFLFIVPTLAAWYICYVVLFNMLVGPVYAAGSITSERERETLDLLLTTMLRTIDIMWPKVVAGLRVSTVLTLFLAPPILLAGIMVEELRMNWFPGLLAYLGIILLTCVTTTTLAMLCSVIFRKSSVSLGMSYLLIVLLFTGPMAAHYFTVTFFEKDTELRDTVELLTFTSPFSAAHSVPLTFITTTSFDAPQTPTATSIYRRPVYLYFLGFYAIFDLLLLVLIHQIFHYRWREAQS